MKIYTVNCELFGTFDHITPENIPGPKTKGSSPFPIIFQGRAVKIMVITPQTIQNDHF